MSRRISLTRFLVIFALVALVLTFCIVPISRRMEWSRIEQEVENTLKSLQPTTPNEIVSDEWNCAKIWIVNAYINIFFGPDQTPTPELYLLRDDLDRKLKVRVDVETLKWIWNRLGETGPYGKYYIKKNDEPFRDCLPLLRAGRAA